MPRSRAILCRPRNPPGPVRTKPPLTVRDARQIYNTYTCENVGNLRGHNGKVKSVCWSADDSRIVTAGMDGAVYEWCMKEFKREKEHVLKGTLCGR